MELDLRYAEKKKRLAEKKKCLAKKKVIYPELFPIIDAEKPEEILQGVHVLVKCLLCKTSRELEEICRVKGRDVTFGSEPCSSSLA